MQKNGRPYSEADVRDYRIEVLNELSGRYNTGLRAANAVDFDDLLAFSARLLEESDVLERDAQLAFRHILVDEYQDTNRLQYRIVRALASTHKNITVVGDEDQSIYSWRGADIRNILEFERDFPELYLRLEENYRSTQAILDAASGLVVKNENRIGKTLKAMRTGGGRVENLVARDEYEEALKVATDIQRNGEGKRIACLYRMNAQSRALEEALAGARIRYQVVGAVGFYARREIRDVVSYLRLSLNPDDDFGLPSRGERAASRRGRTDARRHHHRGPAPRGVAVGGPQGCARDRGAALAHTGRARAFHYPGRGAQGSFFHGGPGIAGRRGDREDRLRGVDRPGAVPGS